MQTILLIDNYDSFTFMLADYIRQCGAVCEVIRNDDEALIGNANEFDALVLSPGPQTPQEAGQLMSLIQTYIQQKPILGICLGHQAIGIHLGAQLVKAIKPMHGKIDKITHNHHPMFHHTSTQLNATRYHSLVLQHIPETLEVTALSTQNEVMAIAHKSLLVYGIQFHPESCTTEFGLQLIKNFIALAQQNH